MKMQTFEQQLESVRLRKQEIYNRLSSTDTFSPLSLLNWWIDKPGLVQYDVAADLLTSRLPDGEQSYLSYLDNNASFSMPPTYHIELPYRPEGVVCTVKGSVSSALTAVLYIIGYRDGSKEKVYQVSLNEAKTISFTADGIQQIRLAVKLQGAGSLQLQRIQIGDFRMEAQSRPAAIGKVGQADAMLLQPELEELYIQEADQHDVKRQGQEIVCALPNGRYAYVTLFEKQFPYERPDDRYAVQVRAGHVYEVKVDGEASGNLKLEAVFLGFRQGEAVELKRLKAGSEELLQFKPEVETIKVMIRVQGEGSFRGFAVAVKEKERKAADEANMSLNPGKWFNPVPDAIRMSAGEGALILDKHGPDENRYYISYEARNNNFSRVPPSSIFQVKAGHEYEVYVETETEGDGVFAPLLITYSDTEKLEVVTLRSNERYTITLRPSVTKVRVACSLKGDVKVKLSRFEVRAYPVYQAGNETVWRDAKEVSMLGLLGRKPVQKVKMAAIFDEFTSQCFARECELITFTPDNWQAVLSANMPDLLMVESAWRGNDGAWVKKVQYTGEDSIADLRRLISWCREHSIPTVFWNKEDPVHYEHFIRTAALFDHVFTTDADMVDTYQKELQHQNVYSLQFAANPVMHNPIKLYEERESKACFAGSYYKKHEERSRDMERIFDQAMKHGLVIYDRNYEKIKLGLLPNNAYPERFTDCIAGNLKYYEIDKAYKGYKVMININTVKYSPTMFARRVFEGLASGTPIISNYSLGIQNTFGDLVCITENEQDLDTEMTRLFEDETHYKRIAVRGIREVMDKHTYTHRLHDIAEKVGVPTRIAEEAVTVAAFAETVEQAERACGQYEKQTYAAKQLKLVCLSEDVYEALQAKAREDLTVEYLEEDSRNIRQWAATPYLAVFAAEAEYGENYLKDLMLASKYADSDVIGKASYYTMTGEGLKEENPGAEYEYVLSMVPSRSIFKADLFLKMGLSEAVAHMQEDRDFADFIKYGASLFSVDNYNFVYTNQQELSAEAQAILM